MATVKPNVSTAWASNATYILDPGTPKIEAGWEDEIPLADYQNFMQNRSDEFLKHINEFGIAQWDALTDYPVNGYAAGSDGNIYRSAITPNIGNDPTNSMAEWETVLASEIVVPTVLSVPLDFPTVADALDFISRVFIAQTGSVAIEVTGLILETESVIVQHPNSDKITIRGPAPTKRTLNSIVSTNIVPGGTEVEYAVIDSTGVSVSDHVIITDTTGFTNYEGHLRNNGFWEVVAITPISITVKNLNAQLAPTGFFIEPLEFTSGELVKFEATLEVSGALGFLVESMGSPHIENLFIRQVGAGPVPAFTVCNSGFKMATGTYLGLRVENESNVYTGVIDRSNCEIATLATSGELSGGLDIVNFSNVILLENLLMTGATGGINVDCPIRVQNNSRVVSGTLLVNGLNPACITSQSSVAVNKLIFMQSGSNNIGEPQFLVDAGAEISLPNGGFRFETGQQKAFVIDGGTFFANLNEVRLGFALAEPVFGFEAINGAKVTTRDWTLSRPTPPAGGDVCGKAVFYLEKNSYWDLESLEILGAAGDFAVTLNAGTFLASTAQFWAAENSHFFADGASTVYSIYLAFQSSFIGRGSSVSNGHAPADDNRIARDGSLIQFQLDPDHAAA